MKRERLQQDVLKWTKWLLMIIFFMLLFYALSFLKPVWDIALTLIWPIVCACVAAYLLHPIIEKLVHLGLSRGIATFGLFFSFIVIIGVSLLFGVPALMKQVNEAMDVLPQHLGLIKQSIFSLQQSAESLPDPFGDHVSEWSGRVESFAARGLDQLETVILALIRSSMTWVIVPFLVFYLLKDYTLLQRVGYYLTPRPWRKKALRYLHDVDHTFGSYIRGQLLVALCVGGLSTIVFWLLGVPYPIVLGLFVGATDLIPYFGALIGAIPAVGAALLESTTLGIYTAISLIIIQQIEGNVLSPLIVGRTVHLHPVFIILALLIGVESAGVIGLLIAVPLAAIIKVTVLHIRQLVKGDIEFD